MMGTIFDGKKFAREIEVKVKTKTAESERKYKLVTIYDPEDRASRIYTKIKGKKAEELGIEFFQIQNSNYAKLPAGKQGLQIKSEIQKLNSDDTVDGIMVQLPMENSDELISLIDKNKDVDGLKEDSLFVPATVRAIMTISNYAVEFLNNCKNNLIDKRVVIVGNHGEVGRRLMKQIQMTNDKLQIIGMDCEDFDTSTVLKADVIVSCTGQEGLIKTEMVKAGAICIDVGYPKGDFVPEVAQKAAFFTPVPGGVGPVTVSMLFANLVGV